MRKGAEGLRDALLVAAFDGTAQAQAFADLLVAVRVLELVVERLGQIVGDQPITTGQVSVAVLGHLPAGKVAGRRSTLSPAVETVRHRVCAFRSRTVGAAGEPS